VAEVASPPPPCGVSRRAWSPTAGEPRPPHVVRSGFDGFTLAGDVWCGSGTVAMGPA
jgi:hypothetical protein